MSAGFYKRRRGVVEHVDAGVIDLLELGVHDYLNLKANLVIGNGWHYPAGVCVTSAVALQSVCPRICARTMQRILNKLERLGWIKTWKTPGKHGNYVVLICRASVHDLSGKEYRVSGAKTTDWRNPVYEAVAELFGNCPGSVREVSALREVKTLEVRVDNKAVRRTVKDAELRSVSKPSPKKNTKKQKKDRLASHLAAKISRDGERAVDWDWSKWESEIREVSGFLDYKFDRSDPQLSANFLMTACEVYDEARGKDVTAGNLCSKIIDRCERYNKESPNEGYYWPPNFQEHRDRLRQKEKSKAHAAD